MKTTWPMDELVLEAPCGKEGKCKIRHYPEARTKTWECGCFAVEDLAGGYEEICTQVEKQ